MVRAASELVFSIRGNALSSNGFEWKPVADHSAAVEGFAAVAVVDPDDVHSMPKAPVAVAAVAILISLVLTRFGATSAALLGYFLTPFVVVACLGWARWVHLRELDNPWFDRGRARRMMLILQVMAALSFLIAVPHVLSFARAAALWFE